MTAYVVIGFAARREWRDERFRHLDLATTRERRQDVSVLFGDLVGFTQFSERATPAATAAALKTYRGPAAPLITRRFGGELEEFIGDSIAATFNSRGDQPDHALRAARAALALQEELTLLAAEHPDRPQLRVGVNSGEAVLPGNRRRRPRRLPTGLGDTTTPGSRSLGASSRRSKPTAAETYEPTARRRRRRGESRCCGSRARPT